MSSGRNEATETIRNLPVPVGPARARPSLSIYRPTAPFVAQMLVTAPRPEALPAPRPRAGQAIGAYAAGSMISVRRVPAGFRRTLVV
jgi:hypothetical protein